MDILNGYFLKKNDTSIWNVYLSDSRKKRTIQNNPARFLLFLLDATRHVRFSTIIFRLPIFYSFMNRKIHAHFHWQPISIVRYCSFSFFREDYAETVIVLFLIFRIGLFNNICPYCLPVCPPARRHFSDPL